jgi:hypothetical protein
MRCRELSGENVQIGITSQFSYNDIVVSIPNNAPLGGQIMYENTTTLSHRINSDNVQNLTIYFTDDDQNELDFENGESYWAFRFDIWRRMRMDVQPRMSDILWLFAVSPQLISS